LAGTATAWIAELHAKNDNGAAAQIASVANFIGLAVGSLLAGVLAQYAAWPLRLAYVVYLIVLVVIAIAILFAPETVKDTKQRLSELSLRPRLGVPREIRLQFLSPAVTAFATFALIRLLRRAHPQFARRRPSSDRNSGLGRHRVRGVRSQCGDGNGHLPASQPNGDAERPRAPATQPLAAHRCTDRSVDADPARGRGAQRRLRRARLKVVNRISPSDRRSEVVSSYLVAVYAGNSVPVIGIGLLSTITASLVAHEVFAVVIMVLAVAAFAAGVKYSPQQDS
jgi:hypothetical protein